VSTVILSLPLYETVVSGNMAILVAPARLGVTRGPMKFPTRASEGTHNTDIKK